MEGDKTPKIQRLSLRVTMHRTVQSSYHLPMSGWGRGLYESGDVRPTISGRELWYGIAYRDDNGGGDDVVGGRDHLYHGYMLLSYLVALWFGWFILTLFIIIIHHVSHQTAPGEAWGCKWTWIEQCSVDADEQWLVARWDFRGASWLCTIITIITPRRRFSLPAMNAI